jgi:hypothetical protein
MGSASVPSSTSQYQQLATGIWGSPQATKLAMPILKPALGNIKEQQDMLLGVQHGDPSQLAAFFGLPEGASTEEAGAAAHRYMSGPKIAMPPPDAGQKPEAPPTKLAARGGIMSLDDDERTFADGGDTTPKDLNRGQANTLASLQRQLDAGRKLSPANQKKYDYLTQTRQAFQQYTAQQDAGKANLAAQGITPAAAYMGQAGFFGGAYDPATGTFRVTNPYYNQATDVLQQMNKQPEQFGQATQAYNQAIQGLQNRASYTPQQVQAAQGMAAQANRGDIRDIAAQQAQVERYNATPIAQTKREKATQTAAPQSWTDPGVARQYMNPYTQNVLDQELFEANRQAQMRENQQRSQATQQKAFGGTRAALQESEGRRNLGYTLADIEQKGLQQAYGQGMGQFQQEQQLGSQVGLANTQAINQLKSQYMNMGLTEAQANQAAMNAASQFGAAAQNQAYNNYVAQQLAAQQANQGVDWNTVNLNTMNQQQANLQNAQLAQQAALANQSAGLQANQQNVGAYGQMLGGAGGLGSLGSTIGGYNTNLANMWGQAGSTLQGLGQGYFNQLQQNAANIYGGPTTLANQGMGILGGMGGGQSGMTNQIQKIQ